MVGVVLVDVVVGYWLQRSGGGSDGDSLCKGCSYSICTGIMLVVMVAVVVMFVLQVVVVVVVMVVGYWWWHSGGGSGAVILWHF